MTKTNINTVALRAARRGVPTGGYWVDAQAIRLARQGVPTGAGVNNLNVMAAR